MEAQEYKDRHIMTPPRCESGQHREPLIPKLKHIRGTSSSCPPIHSCPECAGLGEQVPYTVSITPGLGLGEELEVGLIPAAQWECRRID
eukprot:6457888-Amphidinium_carterae.3